MMQKLFGSTKPAFDVNNKEQIRELEREYKRKLQREMRELERDALRNELTSKKVELELRKALKESKDRSIHTTYAKQVAQSRLQKVRLLKNKTKVQGLIFLIQSMFTNIKMTNKLGDSTGIARQINGLMNVKEISQTIKDIQKPMMQFGLINELVDDIMDELDDGDSNDMGDTEFDKIIEDVRLPEKCTQCTQHQEEMHKNNDCGDLEAKLKELS